MPPLNPYSMAYATPTILHSMAYANPQSLSLRGLYQPNIPSLSGLYHPSTLQLNGLCQPNNPFSAVSTTQQPLHPNGLYQPTIPRCLIVTFRGYYLFQLKFDETSRWYSCDFFGNPFNIHIRCLVISRYSV